MSRVVVRILFVACVFAGLAGSIHVVAQDSPPKNDEVVYEIHKAGEYGVTAPKGISMPQPEYTDEARRKKINGTVLLSIVVGTDGNVREAEVTKSLDKGLDKQSVKTVKAWTFQPATKDGQPVPVRMDVEVTFRIR